MPSAGLPKSLGGPFRGPRKVSFSPRWRTRSPNIERDPRQARDTAAISTKSRLPYVGPSVGRVVGDGIFLWVTHQTSPQTAGPRRRLFGLRTAAELRPDVSFDRHKNHRMSFAVTQLGTGRRRQSRRRPHSDPAPPAPSGPKCSSCVGVKTGPNRCTKPMRFDSARRNVMGSARQ